MPLRSRVLRCLLALPLLALLPSSVYGQQPEATPPAADARAPPQEPPPPATEPAPPPAAEPHPPAPAETPTPDDIPGGEDLPPRRPEERNLPRLDVYFPEGDLDLRINRL